jgi:hypothetical protein
LPCGDKLKKDKGMKGKEGCEGGDAKELILL